MLTLMHTIVIEHYLRIIGEFYNVCGNFTWRVSDCEELSGSYSQEMMGLVLVNYLVKYLVNLIIGSPALI